jgi:hypothetical protein
VKRVFLGRNPYGLSAVPPLPYSNRFLWMFRSRLNVSLVRYPLFAHTPF